MEPAAGPTLLGFNVILVGTIVAMVIAAARAGASYGSITIRDLMTKRLKALNERRAELKSGLMISTSRKRASLVRKTATTDKIRDFLGNLKVLQDSQVAEVQQRLAQAGIRKK